MPERPVLMIVDDEARILAALKRTLRREGFEVVTYESAREALDALTVRPVDAVLTDHKMPGMSGSQLLAEAVDVRRGRIPAPEPAPVRLELPLSAYLPDAYVGAAGAKLEVYRRFSQVRTDADADALRAHLTDRFGAIPPEVEGLFRAVAVRLAAEMAGVSEVRVDEGRLTLRWVRYQREAVTRALTVAGFRPVAGSNQVRIPLTRGRDPVQTTLRVLSALLPGS